MLNDNNKKRIFILINETLKKTKMKRNLADDCEEDKAHQAKRERIV